MSDYGKWKLKEREKNFKRLTLFVLSGSTLFVLTNRARAKEPVFKKGPQDKPEIARQISLSILRECATQRAISNVDEFQTQ